MKRFISVFASVFVLMFVLSACSEAEEKTVTDIFNNAVEASNSLESFAMDMEMDMDMSVPDLPSQQVKVKTKAEVVTEPLALHQTMDFMGQSIEMYFTEEGMYMQQPGNEQWIKAPKEMMNEITQMSQAQQNPGEQLEQLKKYMEDFKMEEKENTYVLSVSSSGDKMKDFIKETLQQNLPESSMSDDMLKGVTINSINYTFTIDKETYYPTALDLKMDLEIEQNGQKSKIKQNIKGTYSKYNEIGEITVPEEIKNNAMEMPMGPQ